LIDDALDYSAEPKLLGKNIGDDLAEGKSTLPLIYAMENGSEEDVAYMRQAIEQGGLENMEGVITALKRSDAIAYTQQVARAEAEKAIGALPVLPDSEYRQSLEQLARYAVERKT
jgi:octaprenyl-diphosphate synthase